VTVAVPAGGANPTIFVADSGNKRIVGMDDISGANFTVYSGFSSGSSGENPQDVDLDLQGRIYIASYPRAIVRVDDLNGTNKVEYGRTARPARSGWTRWGASTGATTCCASTASTTSAARTSYASAG
jgi:hypothetical protein